jgi:hypothetical protein
MHLGIINASLTNIQTADFQTTEHVLKLHRGQVMREMIDTFEKGWLFILLRPAQEYFTYMEMSPLPVKGCKI